MELPMWRMDLGGNREYREFSESIQIIQEKKFEGKNKGSSTSPSHFTRQKLVAVIMVK